MMAAEHKAMKCVVSSRYSLHKGHMGSTSLALNLALFVWSIVCVSSLHFILVCAIVFHLALDIRPDWVGMANGKSLDDEQAEGGCGIS